MKLESQCLTTKISLSIRYLWTGQFVNALHTVVAKIIGVAQNMKPSWMCFDFMNIKPCNQCTHTNYRQVQSEEGSFFPASMLANYLKSFSASWSPAPKNSLLDPITPVKSSLSTALPHLVDARAAASTGLKKWGGPTVQKTLYLFFGSRALLFWLVARYASQFSLFIDFIDLYPICIQFIT